MVKRCVPVSAWMFMLGTLLLSAAPRQPSPLDAGEPWSFMVIGDSRGAWPEIINTNILSELVAEAKLINPVFVLFSGDLVWWGNLKDFQTWKALVADLDEAGIGIFPVMGNHDAPDPVSYLKVFRDDIPDNGPAEALNRTYFIAQNNALVLALDYYANKAQMLNLDWVNSVLATNTRPHVFAMGHLPAFKVAHPDCLDDFPDLRNAFWRRLRGAGCRAYFAGHDHFYDHMRVEDGDGNPDNDVHQVIVGTAGAPFYLDAPYNGDNGTWQPVRVYHEANFGYVLVEIAGRKATLTWFHRTAPGTYEPTEESWSYLADPPIHLNFEPLDTGQVRFWFMAWNNAPYTIEGSGDLRAWDKLATAAPQAGRVSVLYDPAGKPFHFFRVRQEAVE
jgi:hypothetical protein